MLGLVPVLHEVCSDSRDRKKLLFLHIQTQQEIHSERLGKIFDNVLCEVHAQTWSPAVWVGVACCLGLCCSSVWNEATVWR